MSFVWLDAEAIFVVLCERGPFETPDEWFAKVKAIHPHFTRDIFDESLAAIRGQGWLELDKQGRLIRRET